VIGVVTLLAACGGTGSSAPSVAVMPVATAVDSTLASATTEPATSPATSPASTPASTPTTKPFVAPPGVPASGVWPTTRRPSVEQLVGHLALLPAVPGMTQARVAEVAAVRSQLQAAGPLSRSVLDGALLALTSTADLFTAFVERDRGFDASALDWWASGTVEGDETLGVAEGPVAFANIRSAFVAAGSFPVQVGGVELLEVPESIYLGPTAFGLDPAHRRLWYTTVPNGVDYLRGALTGSAAPVSELPGVRDVLTALGPAYGASLRWTFPPPIIDERSTTPEDAERVAREFQADRIPPPIVAATATHVLGPRRTLLVGVRYADPAPAQTGLEIALANMILWGDTLGNAVGSRLDGAVAIGVLGDNVSGAQESFERGKLPFVWTYR
jgi:hypothetical protein